MRLNAQIMLKKKEHDELIVRLENNGYNTNNLKAVEADIKRMEKKLKDEREKEEELEEEMGGLDQKIFELELQETERNILMGSSLGLDYGDGDGDGDGDGVGGGNGRDDSDSGSGSGSDGESDSNSDSNSNSNSNSNSDSDSDNESAGDILLNEEDEEDDEAKDWKNNLAFF